MIVKGDTIEDAAHLLLMYANENEEVVGMEFNNVHITAWPGDTVESIINSFKSACNSYGLNYKEQWKARV